MTIRSCRRVSLLSDFDGDITEAFGETAEYKVDDNYHALLTWLPDHTEWLEEAEFDGLLEGCKGDIYKMVQMAQYVYFKSDLYDHCEDICRYGTLDQLRDMGVYAIRESLADEILNDLFCGIPAWTVEGDDLAKVNDFLKKSCMEFCGSLPGDEKDEDGYSLSGEAKDATASRNGLSRNQMGIEEKAAECKEAATVLANGNAL